MCAHNKGFVYNYQLSYFCGSYKQCVRAGDPSALQQAKLNLEKYYSVVGCTEDLEKSLNVFEAYLPRFFKGAPQLFKELSKTDPAENAIGSVVIGAIREGLTTSNDTISKAVEGIGYCGVKSIIFLCLLTTNCISHLQHCKGKQ